MGQMHKRDTATFQRVRGVLEGTQLTLIINLISCPILHSARTLSKYKNSYSACICTPECAKIVVDHNHSRLYIAYRTIPPS